MFTSCMKIEASAERKFGTGGTKFYLIEYQDPVGLGRLEHHCLGHVIEKECVAWFGRKPEDLPERMRLRITVEAEEVVKATARRVG